MKMLKMFIGEYDSIGLLNFVTVIEDFLIFEPWAINYINKSIINKIICHYQIL